MIKHLQQGTFKREEANALACRISFAYSIHLLAVNHNGSSYVIDLKEIGTGAMWIDIDKVNTTKTMAIRKIDIY